MDKPNIKIGEGSIICAGTILTTNLVFGKFTQLNLLTTIGHDTILGDFCTTGPGVNISGNCNIGNNVILKRYIQVRDRILPTIAIIGDQYINIERSTQYTENGVIIEGQTKMNVNNNNNGSFTTANGELITFFKTITLTVIDAAGGITELVVPTGDFKF